MIFKERPLAVAYQETMVACANKVKRRNAQQQIEALEAYHNCLQPAYNLYLAYSVDGYARYGTGFAVRSDVEVVSHTDSLVEGKPEEHGRFLAKSCICNCYLCLCF